MTGPRNYPPRPIIEVLDIGIDAMLGGSHGYLQIPKGGYLNVTWLPTKECYRLTIDVTAGHPLSDEAEAFNAETRRKIAMNFPPTDAVPHV